MKKSLITLTVMLTAAALIAVFSGPAAAKVTGVCSGCHTMHNSQDGSALAGGPRATLLANDCVGCHSRTDSSTTYTIGECTVPVVYNTSEPNYGTDTLAGGNFYWVSTGCAGPNCGNAKGHNVLGISDKDTLSLAPGGFSCGNVNCHVTLAEPPTDNSYGPGGCQGCHLRPAHHADDSDVVVGSEDGDDDGFYRFLSGHMSAMTPEGLIIGVAGIEDSDWQANCGAGDHNEYLGLPTDEPYVGDKRFAAGFYNLGHTMTGFCCGCHGDFHIQDTTFTGASPWIRHPSDAGIPATGEYQYAFGSAGSGATGTYDPDVPVARASLSSVSNIVTIGGTSPDMVMCLSCHRPHGSPYDDMLRWDYEEMIAGSGANTTGCFVCHTKKDTGG